MPIQKLPALCFGTAVGFSFVLTFHFLTMRVTAAQEHQVVTPLTIIAISPTPQQAQVATNSNPLGQIVENQLKGVKGDYAVVIKNPKTGETYRKNDHTRFEPASLYKLWIMAATFEKIESGELSLDEKMSEDINTLNEKFLISSESAELTDGVVSMTVRQAIEKMITISDNYSALLLSAKIRISAAQKFLTSYDLDESRLGTQLYTTAHDIEEFLEKLYDGKIINQKYSDEMLEILSRQERNEMIPKYLPAGTAVAHKTGELDGYKHNAGIVFGKHDYIIVVMTNSNDPQAAAEKIAEISKEVYEYFQK